LMLPVEAQVALVGVVGEGNLDGVVVGGETGGRQTGDRETGDLFEVADDLRESGLMAPAGIGVPAGIDAGDGILDRLTTRMPFSSFCVGRVSTLSGLRTWRKPS
jgi:hypothetical protein